MKTMLSRLAGFLRSPGYVSFTRVSLLSVACAVPRWTVAGAVPVVIAAVWGGIPAAAAAQEEGVAKVRDLNKKAVDAYENLDLEESRKFLTQALEVSAAEGLNRHPIKATTHLNMGVVLVGGLKQRDAGIKQFRRALEIDPQIKVPKRLNNPEIQSAFEAAQKPEGPEAGGTPTPPVAGTADNGAVGTLTIGHEALTESPADQAIDVQGQVQGGTRFDKVVLAYRAEGESDFLSRDMDRLADGSYMASIPDVATHGASVAYYLEVRGRGGQSLARNGSPDAPHVITLVGPEIAGAEAEAEAAAQLSGRALRRRNTTERTWLALGLGLGGGWAKGTPEINRNFVQGDGDVTRPIEFNNVAPAKLLHFSPELGYLVTPRLMLSLQGRLQVTTGASEVVFNTCKPDGVCQPATGAVAVLGKLTYLFRSGGDWQPYVSLAAGGGYIRYVVDLSEYKLSGCGGADGASCFDTVAGGGVLIGPSFGTWYNLTGPLYLTAAVNSLLGIPGTMFNVDVNLGVGYRL